MTTHELIEGAQRPDGDMTSAEREKALDEFAMMANRSNHKTGAVIRALHTIQTGKAKATCIQLIQPQEILNAMPDADRKHFSLQHTLVEIEAEFARAVFDFAGNNPIYFATSAFYVSVEYLEPAEESEGGGIFVVRLINVLNTVRKPLPYIARPHIAYTFNVKKRRQLKTLDRFSLMRNIYAFIALTIVNIATLIIVGVSLKAVSIAYLAPAAYAIYYIYSEAMFLSQRVRIYTDIYSRESKIKTLVYNEDRSQLLIRKGTISADCPICGGSMSLSRNAAQYNGRIVARCDRNHFEHAFSFDPITLTGQFLN